jgi:hypothetical protein
VGGSAPQHLGVTRVDAATYQLQAARVKAIFTRLFAHEPTLIDAYRTKPDFGDCDLLIVESVLPADWREQFCAAVSSKGLVRNGGVSSIEVDGLQFDFITCAADKLHWSKIYFAYNDLGNLMGRIAHKMGFKYGHDGLRYVMRQGPQVLADIEIDLSPSEVFSLMDYDYTRWQKGFDTLNDIFEYTASSAYFHPDIYLLHNRNHEARVRDAKRKSYNAFLAWCETHQGEYAERAYHWPADDDAKSAEKATHLERVIKAWPPLATHIEVAQAKANADRARKLIWNGELVKAWTGLEGRALGRFMTQCATQPDFESTLASGAIEAWAKLQFTNR